MDNVQKLLDEVKRIKGIKSDYALAKSLELPTQRISDYYKTKTMPDDYACMKIAEALEKPLAEVIAIVRIEVEKDEKRREAWRKYYKSLGSVAASIIMTIAFMATMIVTSKNAEAEIYKEKTNASHCLICIM